ncbi:MAG: hypothetical protein LH479_03405 [Polaromonas sp.]|nr:hypothetical protein [Polaromonas sp.]
MSEPFHSTATAAATARFSLRQMQRIRLRLLAQRAALPLEYNIWDGVLTVWIMGWIGWLPAYALEAYWAFPLCLLGIHAPRLYVKARTRAHAAGRLRCDWLDQLN